MKRGIKIKNPGSNGNQKRRAMKVVIAYKVKHKR